MGRRSRKRVARPATAERPVAPRPAQPRDVRRREPPSPPGARAPWHPLPLVELSVLVGIVLIVLGLLVVPENRGRVLVVFGLALGSLGGLDTALREHFAGFRPHSALLAAVPAVLVGAALALAGGPRVAVVPVAAVAYAATFGWARSAYRARVGGRR